MLVAAWGDEGSTRAISIVSVALLVAAGFAAAMPVTGYGVAFDGLYRADAFAAFAICLIYLATGVSILIAPRFFAVEKLKPEYPVLILLATTGAGMMVSASDLITLYIGLELQSLASYVLASFMRRDER